MKTTCREKRQERIKNGLWLTIVCLMMLWGILPIPLKNGENESLVVKVKNEDEKRLVEKFLSTYQEAQPGGEHQ